MSFIAYDVFRVRTGMGLVDYCGVIQAAGLTAAEAIARETISYDPRVEHLCFEEREPTFVCLVCGELSIACHCTD